MAGPTVTVEQLANAHEISLIGQKLGLTQEQRQELIGAAYQESGLREGAVNSSSGAFGLFQLLSSGYVRKYQAGLTAGMNPVDANIQAIIGDYVTYWRNHPNAAPGEAAAAVEASGEPPSWYAAGFSHFEAIGGDVYQTYGAGSAATPGLFGSGTLGGVPATVAAAPGVKQTIAAGSSIAGEISSLGGLIKFLTSWRFAELIGAIVLVAIGLVLLGRQFGVGVPLPGLAARVEDSTGGGDLTGEQQARTYEAGRRAGQRDFAPDTAFSQRGQTQGGGRRS